MKTFAVTAVGGDVGQGVIATLRSAFDPCRIIGTDVHEEHAGILLCDRFEHVPSASDENYLPRLERVCKSQSVDYLLPISEPEIAALRLPASVETVANATVVAPSQRAVKIGLDKYATSEFLRKNNIAGPWTVLADTSLPLDYPCIFKARSGCGSKSVLTVGDVTETAKLNTAGSIWQESLGEENQEYTCGLFRSRLGEIRSIALKRKLQGGQTVSGIVVQRKDISEMLAVLAKRLELIGSINVQLRMTDAGPRIFEINPRFSGTTYFRHSLGFCDVLWALEDLELSVPTPYAEPASGTLVFRISDVIAGQPKTKSYENEV